MAIEKGQIIKAQDVIDKLRLHVRAISAIGLSPHDTIFDDNNSKYRDGNEDSNTGFWKDIAVRPDLVGCATHFLSNANTNILNILPNVATNCNVTAGKIIKLDGYRNLAVSCFAKTSDIRKTSADYYSLSSGKKKQIINYLYLQPHAISSMSVDNYGNIGRQFTATDDMFRNSTEVPEAKFSYSDTLNAYATEFSAKTINMGGNDYYLNYSLTDTAPDKDLSNAIFSKTPTGTETGGMLYVKKSVNALDALNSMNFLKQEFYWIRNNLSCQFGTFSRRLIQIKYVKLKNKLNNIDLPSDKTYESPLMPLQNAIISSLNGVYSQVDPADSKHYLNLHYSQLNDYFMGWTPLKSYYDDVYMQASDLSSFIPAANINAPLSLDFEKMKKSDDTYHLLDNLVWNSTKVSCTLTLYPVFLTNYHFDYYFGMAGWRWNDPLEETWTAMPEASATISITNYINGLTGVDTITDIIVKDKAPYCTKFYRNGQGWAGGVNNYIPTSIPNNLVPAGAIKNDNVASFRREVLTKAVAAVKRLNTPAYANVKQLLLTYTGDAYIDSLKFCINEVGETHTAKIWLVDNNTGGIKYLCNYSSSSKIPHLIAGKQVYWGINGNSLGNNTTQSGINNDGDGVVYTPAFKGSDYSTSVENKLRVVNGKISFTVKMYKKCDKLSRDEDDCWFMNPLTKMSWGWELPGRDFTKSNIGISTDSALSYAKFYFPSSSFCKLYLQKGYASSDEWLGYIAGFKIILLKKT